MEGKGGIEAEKEGKNGACCVTFGVDSLLLRTKS